MPRITKRDPSVARGIRAALTLLRSGQPKDAKLKKRADAGTLRVNFNTVEIESGVKRHVYDRPGTPYQAEHDAIAAAMPARGSVEPLRQQLDRDRKKLQQSEARLNRSRTYAAQLLAHTQKLNQEIARLKALVAGDAPTCGSPNLISDGRLDALPPMRRKQRGKANGAVGAAVQQARGVGR